MAFDVREYIKNRNQNAESDNNKSNTGFDVRDYVKQKNLPQVGEYLSSSITNWLEKNESFYNENRTRFSVENPSYRTDASDWLSTVTTKRSDLEKEATEIKSWLDMYKDYFNEDYYSSVVKALDGNIEGYEKILSAATEDSKFWSNFKTEDAYKEWVSAQEEEKKRLSFDLEAGEVEINDLEAKYGEASKIANELNSLKQTIAYGYTRAGYSPEGVEKAVANDSRVIALNQQLAQYGNPSELASALSEKKAYYTLAERAQRAAELSSVGKAESKNYDPAFEKYAAQGEALGNDPEKWWQNAENIIANRRNDPEFIEAYEESAESSNTIVKNTTLGQLTYKAAKYMSEDEFKLYNYYFAKDKEDGTNLAEEYLGLIEETLNTRQAVGISGEIEGKPVLQVLFAFEAGLDQFASGIKGWFADGYTPASGIQIASGMVREDLADTGAKLPDWLGGSSLGQVGYDIVNTTSNMLPSILASTAANIIAPGSGAIVGASLMGASAGGNAKVEMLNLGYSNAQATSYGIMVGVAEGSMEYLLGNIPGVSKGDGIFSTLGTKVASKVDNAISRVAIKLGNNGTSFLRAVANGAIKVTGGALDEALEEGLQTVIEPWLKEVATGVDWDDPNIDEILYSSLLGALSSVALGGFGDASGEVKTIKAGKNVQKIEGGVAKLQELGNTFSADTVAYKIAGKVNAQTDAYTIGKLFNEVKGTISEQNVTEIANGLMAKGMSQKTANNLARQYQAILNADMNISDEAKKILNDIPGLNSVLRENLINKNTTVYQRTRAYSDLMNLADETANKKKGKTTAAKVDSLESLANAMAARGLNDNGAEVMAKGIKSKLTAESSTSSATEVSPADVETMQRIASEVATGSRTSASERFVKDKFDSAKSTAEERLGVEGKYTSSETGATRLASNKKKVNIVGVDSIGKDILKLKLDDGSIVNADEIDFSTSDEALVYEAVTNMGVSANTAWDILKEYNPKSGQSGTIYAMGALEAYTYGHNGVKVDGMSKDGFAALLSPTQKNTANRLGDIDAMAKVNAQQKTIDKAVKSVRDEAKSKHKAIPKRNGEVVFEGNFERLTEHQESQIKVLEPVAKGLGVTFHIFESDENLKYTMPDDTIRSANGWYDPKTGEIWIDLRAGNFGQGTIIFTAAHELTHFIKQWSPAKFKIFADFLFEQYGKKGQDVNQLIQRQIEKAAAKNRTIGWDEAYEEVVADSCETFLRDSKAAEKIAALREKDIGLANKIKTFLGQMLAKMRKVMADLGLAPETPEGQMVAEMTDSLQKLYDLWTDALADAGEAYSTVDGEIDLDGDSNVHKLSDRTIIEGAGLQFIPDEDGTHYTVLDAYGNAVESVTPEMIANSPLGQLVSSAKDNGFLGEGKVANAAAKKQYEFLAELVNMCINYDGLAPIWETAGTMVFSSIKSNADKQYGLTIDFSTVCKKTQAIVDAMSEAMVRLGRGLTRSEVETIYLEVGKAGESTPCPVCYVFSRWMGIGGILDQMSRFQDKYTNMSEGELQSFIANIKERISERANTPNKKGELKKDFFDKNGAIKEGQVIADLKQKANSGAGSTLNAITKNSDIQLQIQELQTVMENQDAKEAKKTAAKIKKLEAKLVDVSSLEKQFKEYNDTVEEYEAYQWLTRTLMEEVDGEWRKNKKFKPVPKDVLFDLNKGATFAEDYPLSWAFRTGNGASAGKAITPYADARVGEAIQGIASQDVKNIKTGIDLNPFLNGDEKTRQKIIASAIEKQARQNLIGGQRYQSTSDFRYEYGSDYLITFLEMQAIGAKVQLYTKVIEAVDFLASMGADINLSVMPLSDGYVTLPNGKKKLIYSSVTGIDAEAAIKKAHEYNNVQLILVGISDEHIRLALEGDDVTFVIPFHGSGNSVHQIQALMNLLGENLDVTTAEDYTAVQSDHVSPKQTKEQKAMWDLRVKILTGKASTLSASEFSLLDKNAYLKDLYNRFYVNENADEFGINLSKDVAEQIFPYEYWDKSLTYAEADKNGERFKEYCASMGIIPRFSGMNSKGENVGFGDFTNNKGYWKLLIDRPMYDNTYDADGNWTGYGKYHEQKRINCSNFQVKHLDPEYGSATYGEVMSKANDPKKTNMIVDRAIAQFEDAKFSDRDSRIADTQAKITARYKRTVDKVLEGTYGSKDSVLMGYTPDIFRKLGMPSLPFVIGAGHIYSITVTEAEAKADPLKRYNKNTNYHGLGADKTKNLYTAIQDPVMIIAAKDTDKKNTAPRSLHSVVAIIDVGNASEKLLMPVEVTAERRVDGMSINVNTLSSSYMANVEGLVREAIAQTNIGDIGVYYMKKEATNLLRGRVQFPKRLTDKVASSDGIIHQFSEKINMQIDDVTKSLQFTSWFGDWQNEPEKASKVVNDDGTPMVVYHGTKSGNIKTFRTTNENGTGGLYLSTNRSVAKAFAGDGGEVYENYVNLRKPLIVDADGAYYDSIAVPSEMVGSRYTFGGNTVDTNAIAAYAREAGYDGVIVKNVRESAGFGDDIIAFKSNQVKSVDNVGTFDRRKDNTMYSDRVLMGSLFSGGGTLEAGLVYQMLDKEFAVEFNKKIAATYTDNHGKEHMFVGDVRDFNSKDKQNVFYLHASPVCKNFSPASHSGGETTLDITTAQATARVLEEQMPQVFTVENVKRYIGSEAYNIIINKLNELGYTWDVDVYKASDYGNATKRERMIIRAVKDGQLPEKPQKASNITSWGEATRDLWETDLIPSTIVRSKIDAIKNTPKLKGVKLTKLDKPLMIYDTTKSKTAIFAWADELAPTLTTKCGDARIIMPDGRVYAPTPKFMGRIQGLPDDYKYPKAVTNAFKIIGNGIPTQLTKAVMGGVLDSAYEQTHDGQVLYSDRSPGSVSTRSLLANALETTVQNDIERNRLVEYKGKIDLIEQEQEKLTKLKAEIKALSFAKGSRDTARIKQLQFEANQTANRINTYDRQLLNLESTTALKNVLQREKKLAYDKAKKEGKAALARYREKAAKTQRELMERNTESRKKAIESRNKTEMKHKIQKVVGDLKALLLDPTKDKHVPIGLQKPVAEALDVINMDTMGADERIAKYNEMIHKSKDPDIIAELTKSRDRIALQGENLADKLNALKQAYAEIKNSDDPLVRDSHNEAIEDLIANTSKEVGNTSLRDMSYEQLEAVYDMYKAILATVRNANKLFKATKQETITDNSESVKREVRAAGGHRDRVLKATKFLKKFGWNMLKPIYAMKLIGSDTLTRLYENVRKGEDTWAVDVNEAKDFFKETAKKYEYNTWDFEKPYTFTDSIGNSFTLTLEQIMSLYAYSKREQADKHLEVGGFIFDDAIEVKEKTKLGIPLTYEVNDANPYRLKKEDLGKIISLLNTDLNNVKKFVDEMQAYLSDVMGAKGNEVSLAMYDIKLYKEQNYFPLKTAKYFREFDPEKNGTPKIKNSGFSKKTVPQAGNPIILSNFMDVWANHVNDMSMYHAFVLPLEDFMRVYNYSSTAGGYDSVQQYIKNAYGTQANTYIETLMNDLNGGARTDPATDPIGKGISRFKKAAVFASASVVIQQPSAIARALAYVDAKYFVDKPEAAKHKETWAEVKKYAPVAIVKEMGYFDTNMGRSTVDWIKEEKTWRDKVDDIASKAPALADELSWCAIWKAVKREVAATTKLEVGSEAFLKKAGERFTEVVTKTQVYDSVLSRSALMRSKDTGAKMVTAFMAEPTTSLNMVVDAIIEGKRGNKKFAKKAVGAVAASIILNSILVSLVTAARDDDDDETYTEKYLESLTADLLDGFNPLTYIPLIKDIWSIMQGYDVERSDMSVWSDLWASVENLFSDKKSGFEKTEGIVGAIASIFGLPLKNLMRDARAIYNLFATLLSGTPTTWAGVGDAVGGAVTDSIPLYSRIEKWAGADESKSDKLYDAIISGNQKHIDRKTAQYKDDKVLESAMRQGLRENDSRIHEAAQARYDGDIEKYKRIAKEIIAEGYFSQDTVVAAINSEINAIKKGETAEEEHIVDSTEKVTSIYKASDINSAFESGDTDMALEVIDDLFKTKVANGMTEKEAKSSIRSSMTTYWKPLYKAAYKSKDTAEQERIKKILKDSGMYGNASDVIKTVREWRTERD